jgi:benzoate-CoA ligase
MIRDSPELVSAWFGTMAGGGVAVALSTRLAGEDLVHVLRNSGATLFLAEAVFAAECGKAIEAAGGECRLQILDPATDGGANDAAPIWVETDERDEAFWVYSSGSTNRPKAVVHTHHDVAALSRLHREHLGLGAGDLLYGTSKLFFAYTLSNVMLAGLSIGAALLVDREWPHPERVVQLVAERRPKAFFSTPSLYRVLVAHCGERLRAAFAATAHCLSAGEHLPAPLGEAWEKQSGKPLWDGYGCSETLALVIASSPLARRLGTTGRPTPGVECRLVGPDGSTITASGSIGVLWVRYPFLAIGYHKLPAETARRFRTGWFVTGDLFELDADGFWLYRGREDDLIKVAGQWVRLGEIEEIAAKIAGLRDVAVVAITDETGTSRAALFVVAAEDQNSATLLPVIRDTLAAQLPRHKIPRWVVPLDALPRTATGKIARAMLGQMLPEVPVTA